MSLCAPNYITFVLYKRFCSSPEAITCNQDYRTLYSTPEHSVSIYSFTALEVLGLLIVDVSKTPRSVGPLQTNDVPTAETSS